MSGPNSPNFGNSDDRVCSEDRHSLTVFPLVDTVLHTFPKLRIGDLGPVLLFFYKDWHYSLRMRNYLVIAHEGAFICDFYCS